MYRTWVITRHTFFEAISQPIYSLLLGFGAAILIVFMFLPFFTLGEDTVMFKSVGIDVILLLVLLATLFATSRSIHEEIEDRTMLTLMSKSVSRLEVLLGKYFGLIGSSLLGIVLLGALLCWCTWYRIPGDYMINYRSIDDREVQGLMQLRQQHLSGLYPTLLLMWLQVSVLAAISVVISTRFSLVVNLPVVILLYIAGNLARFIDEAVADRWLPVRLAGKAIESVLPFLAVFDIKRYAIYGQIGLTSNDASGGSGYASSFIWSNAGLASLYAVFYVAFAMAIGMLIFRNRELGGNEG
jgi:ABC-type transport system involved in multi-copper enzyme maturation permease subunit